MDGHVIQAAALLGYPFRKQVSSSSRVAGCFYDPNGKVYFNKQQPENPTWGYSVCQRFDWFPR